MDISRSKIHTSFFLIIIITLAFTLRYSTLKNHVIPSGDEGSFLSLALNISEGKGFTNNVIWHYYHKNESLPYPEDTRHPLYAIFIAGLYQLTGVSLRPAQWLNVVFNLISIVLVFLLGRKLHSDKAGLFAAFLMAISWPQIKYSAFIYSEALFELLFLIILYLYCKIFIDGEDSKKEYFLIGILIGLSYLCRPNGIFVFISAVILGWVYYRRKIGWISLGFFLIAGWWMGRNIVLFGNPLYGHFNYFMWIDSHHELWYTILDKPPSLLSFMQTHSFLEIVTKFFKGVVGLLSELWKFEGTSLPLNKILFPFFVWFILRKKYKQDKQVLWFFIFTYLLVTLLPTIWTASVLWVARYLLLFYPLYFLAVSIGLCEIRWQKLSVRGIDILMPIVLLVIVYFQYYPIRFLISERNGDIKRYESIEQKRKWITENLPGNAVILTGSLCQVQYKIKRKMIMYPAFEELDKVLLFSKELGVTHLVIEKTLLEHTPRLQKYWVLENEKIKTCKEVSFLQLLQQSDDFYVYKVEI